MRLLNGELVVGFDLRERLAVLRIHVVDVVEDHAGHAGLREDVAREPSGERDVEAVAAESLVDDAFALAGGDVGVDVAGEQVEDVVVLVLFRFVALERRAAQSDDRTVGFGRLHVDRGERVGRALHEIFLHAGAERRVERRAAHVGGERRAGLVARFVARAAGRGVRRVPGRVRRRGRGRRRQIQAHSDDLLRYGRGRRQDRRDAR